MQNLQKMKIFCVSASFLTDLIFLCNVTVSWFQDVWKNKVFSATLHLATMLLKENSSDYRSIIKAYKKIMHYALSCALSA